MSNNYSITFEPHIQYENNPKNNETIIMQLKNMLNDAIAKMKLDIH